MALSTAIKIAAGVGVSGTAIGGVILTKSYLFPNKLTLKALVEKDKWKVLTPSNDTEIKEILEVYKNKNPLPFSDFTGKESDASAKLLKECKQLFEETEDNLKRNDFLKVLKRWCVIPKTAKERLKDLGVNPLSTEDPKSGSKESTEWVENSRKHTADNKDKFSDLTITQGEDDAEAKKLRDHCKTKLEIKSFKDEFDSTLEKIKIWCSSSQ